MDYFAKYAFVAAVLAMACGCSKQLNPGRAAVLVEEYVKKQNPSTGIGELTSKLGSPLTEKAATIPGMQRLLEQGYIEEEVVKISYPDLTGSYEGVWPIGYVGNRPSIIRLKIDVNGQYRPPLVNANYELFSFFPSEQKTDFGTCSGQQDVSFWMGCRSTTNSVWQLVQEQPKRIYLSPSQGDADHISGQVVRSVHNETAQLSLQGTSAHRSIEQGKYIYKWSAKFPTSLVVKIANRPFDLSHSSGDVWIGYLVNIAPLLLW